MNHGQEEYRYPIDSARGAQAAGHHWDGEAALATAIGRHADTAKITGSGGEIVREEGVVRVSGRGYATNSGIVPAAEIYFAKDGMPREQGPWLGEADKVSWVDPATGLECIMLRDHPADSSVAMSVWTRRIRCSAGIMRRCPPNSGSWCTEG